MLDTSHNSIEAALAQERATVDQATKVQKADAFRSRFEEGSRLPAERYIKSLEEYEKQIGLFEVVDRFVNTLANLHLPNPSFVASPNFNADSFFATSNPSQRTCFNTPSLLSGTSSFFVINFELKFESEQ